MTRPKAFADLSQLPDPQFFEEIAVGLGLVLKNATRYHEAAVVVENAGHRHAVEAIDVFAEEEAAKFIIFLDAVRAPRAQVVRQLSWCKSHLAKGIYVDYYHTKPATFGDVREFVERHRPSLHLDGLNDVDFIMRNGILGEREEKLYVDYIATEEGHYWHTPEIYEHFPRFAGQQPAVLRVATALHAAGFGEPAALAVIAEIWRSVEITDDLRWTDLRVWNLRTIETLAERGLLHGSSDEAADALVDDWLYPLHPLDHSEIKVDPNRLKQERQAAWWSEP